MPQERPNQYGHLIPDTKRNQLLIDCFLSEQISARQWKWHLAEEPGLRDAWDKRLAFMKAAPLRSVLSDGTDISRKTVDQIKAAQQRADQEFFAKNRKISPAFPDIADALEKRRQAREAFAARTLLAMFVGGLIYGIGWDSFGWVVAAFGGVGFVVTCFVAGNRQFVKSGGHSDRSRPF